MQKPHAHSVARYHPEYVGNFSMCNFILKYGTHEIQLMWAASHQRHGSVRFGQSKNKKTKNNFIHLFYCILVKCYSVPSTVFACLYWNIKVIETKAYRLFMPHTHHFLCSRQAGGQRTRSGNALAIGGRHSAVGNSAYYRVQ